MKVKELVEKRKKEYHPTIGLYGRLGTGKTAFVGQAGPGGIVMDFDEGYLTLLELADEYQSLRCETEVETFFEGDLQRPTMYTKARNYLHTLARGCKSDPKNIPTVVVIDSFTGLCECVQALVLKNSGHAGQPPTQPEWGLIFNEIENFIRLFKSLPCIKVLTGHDFLTTDADDNVRYEFLCPGKKLPPKILGFCDDVFYTFIKKKGKERHYTLTSKASAAVAARTRGRFKDDFDMNDGFLKFLEELGWYDPDKPVPDVSKLVESIRSDPELKDRTTTRRKSY